VKRSRVIWTRDGRRIEVPPDWHPTPRPRIAIHGVKQPFRSMADGRWYDDTRTYERELRAQGFEIAGNELRPFLEPDLPPIDRNEIARDVKDAIEQVRAGKGVRPEMIDSVETIAESIR